MCLHIYLLNLYNFSDYSLINFSETVQFLLLREGINGH